MNLLLEPVGYNAGGLFSHEASIFWNISGNEPDGLPFYQGTTVLEVTMNQRARTKRIEHLTINLDDRK